MTFYVFCGLAELQLFPFHFRKVSLSRFPLSADNPLYGIDSVFPSLRKLVAWRPARFCIFFSIFFTSYFCAYFLSLRSFIACNSGSQLFAGVLFYFPPFFFVAGPKGSAFPYARQPHRLPTSNHSFPYSAHPFPLVVAPLPFVDSTIRMPKKLPAPSQGAENLHPQRISRISPRVPLSRPAFHMKFSGNGSTKP